jgi:anti-sigma B factor antagonist
MTMTDFAFYVTKNSHGPVVVLKGDLDLGAAHQLRQCLGGHPGESVTLDFADVTFIDTTAIGVIVTACNRAIDDGGSITVHGVQPAQMTVFGLAGVANYVHVYGDHSAPW